MITFISKKITESFVKNNVIKAEDKEIYSYGLEYIFSSILPVVFAVGISLLIGMTGSVVIYLLTFVSLRIFAGGYHASSHFRCQILFFISMATSMLFVKLISLFNADVIQCITVLIAIVSSGITFLLAPIDNYNKIFSKDEFITFRTRTRFINLIVLIGLLIGVKSTIDISIFLSISVAMLTIAVSLIFATRGRKIDEEAIVFD